MFRKNQNSEEDYYNQAPYADSQYTGDNAEYSNDYDDYEDEYYDNESYYEDMEYIIEERKARSSTWNFLGTILGIIVLFGLIVILISLINWLRSDFYHTFSYVTTIFR